MHSLMELVPLELKLVGVKFLLYGTIGQLIEVWFTGLGSIFRKDHKATCQTYLWMFPLYGGMGLILEFIRSISPLPFWLQALLVYVPLFYLAEFTFGLFLKWLIGIVPWDYGRGHFTPMGLINLKYLPWWLVLGLLFEPLARALQVALKAVVFVVSSDN